MVRILPMATLALFTTTALAQQRLATTGRVFDAGGQSLAGASVTFVGAPLPIVDPYANVDRIEAKSDGEGRFTVQLLPHADYSAWAIAAPSAGGSSAVSAVRHLIAGGDRVVLVTDNKGMISQLQLDVGDWERRGPLTVALAPDLPVIAPQVVAVADGVVTPAPFPGGWHVFVRDCNGALIHAATAKAHAQHVARLKLPPMRDAVARAIDETGAAVAGASIWVRVGSDLEANGASADSRCPYLWQRVGSADADGRLSLTLAIGREMLLLASSPGHRPGLAGWWDGKYHEDQEGPLPTGEKDALLLLRRGSGAVACLKELGNKVFARAMPRFEVRAMAGKSHTWRLVAADDAWEADIDKEGPVHAVTRLPDGPRTVPVLAAVDPDVRAEVAVEDLGTLHLRAPGAKPGASVRVLVQRVLPSAPLSERLTEFSLSLPGTLRLDIGPWRVLACDGERYAWCELQMPPGVVDLELDHSLIVQRGRVTGRAAAEPSGVRFECCPSRLGRNDHALPIELAPAAMLADAPWLPRDFDFVMSTWLAARAQIDDEGAFTIGLLPNRPPPHSVLIRRGTDIAEVRVVTR